MLQRKMAVDTEHAVRIGNDMMKLGLFHHVKFEHAFRNKGYFYRSMSIPSSQHDVCSRQEISTVLKSESCIASGIVISHRIAQ